MNEKTERATVKNCTEKLKLFSTSIINGWQKPTLALVATLMFTSLNILAQWKNPTDQWKTIGPPKGTLLIVGGSAVPSIYKDFIELVGDPKALIVFIPTAGDVVDEKNGAYEKLVEAGAKNLIVLHTKDREEANTEKFVAPLRKAKGVFISGGFQNRLAKAYLHTLTHTAMFNVLDRGGVVAGSSAGASIQGSFLYGGGTEKEGFGFVKDSAIGQHYVRRNRMGSVARILKSDPKLFGFGIDEATGVVVKGNELEVIGDSKVVIYDPLLKDWDAPKSQLQLFPGDKFNLASRKVTYEAIPTPTDLWVDAKKKWKNPSANWNTNGPPVGKLILFGDEKMKEENIKHFFHATTGFKSNIVVLSTGNSAKKLQSDTVVSILEKLGAKNVKALHTININQANSISFAKDLKYADAVWICDSELWQLADTYLNTLVHKELFDVLDRSGIIATTGRSTAIFSSDLLAQPYRWNKGYGFIKQNTIFSEPLKGKTITTMKDMLSKNQELQAIGLTNGVILEITKNEIKVSGNGDAKLYSASKTKPMILSPGNKYPLSR